MGTVKILLTCPECGDTNWIVRPGEEADGCFECAACGEIVAIEDMCSCTTDELQEKVSVA